MNKQKFIIWLMALLAILALVGVALAAGGAVIGWDVIAGGGGPVEGVPPGGGSITMNDTLGQPVIGTSSGGEVDLNAGYWSSFPTEIKVYLPLIVR